MSRGLFPLRVFAIDREIFVGEAKSLSVPTATGQIQILAEHTPLVSILKEGDIIIEPAEGIQPFDSAQGVLKLPITGGTVEVTDNEVVALVNF
ncbi:MAG: hypothetical protein AAB567_01125 [Patescibacteria group bacterium]